MTVTRRILLGWLVTVVTTAVCYAVFFDGEFSAGGSVPAWLIATASGVAAMTLGAAVRFAGTRARSRASDPDSMYVLMSVAAIVGQGLTIAAEVALGAPALWLSVPIATVVYSVGTAITLRLA